MTPKELEKVCAEMSRQQMLDKLVEIYTSDMEQLTDENLEVTLKISWGLKLMPEADRQKAAKALAKAQLRKS